MKIYDGRESFYQWDLNQKIASTELKVGDQVHFFNMKQQTALVVKAYELDNKIVADVPNILLQSSYPIYVYHYVTVDGSSFTKREYKFDVEQRAKPDDYVYTETEVLTYTSLDKRITDLENREVDIEIEVDYQLSETSENPVANKVVTAELKKKADATALANKVDKVSGKGLSTNDFTDALKARLADSVIVSTSVALGYNAKEYFNGKTGFGAEFIQWDEDDGVSYAQVLIFTWGERYVQNSTGYYEPGNYQSVIYPDGEVYYRTKLFEEEWAETFKDPMRLEWKKISVSQTDLNKAIGDIETSLENIIQKYGLGGDGV